jgi:hypothetical protein
LLKIDTDLFIVKYPEIINRKNSCRTLDADNTAFGEQIPSDVLQNRQHSASLSHQKPRNLAIIQLK